MKTMPDPPAHALVAPFPTDPLFPQLATAADPLAMRDIFRAHLRPLVERSPEILSCRLSRIRYRRNERCLLQYTLHLVDRNTGVERDLPVTGIVYANKERAERAWSKLRAAGSDQGAPTPFSAFEAVAFVPQLAMLVHVFPHDRRLPSLPLLAAGPSPKLEAALLERLGPGTWSAKSWAVESVRYREQLSAVLRYELRARDTDTGAATAKRFYVKTYRDDLGESVYRSLLALRRAADEGKPFPVVEPAAYVEDCQALVLEEAPGVSFEEVLMRGRGVVDAARQVARTVAAFNTAELPTERQHTPADQAFALRRAAGIIAWALPRLTAEVNDLAEAVATRLEEVPPQPVHRDLKTDHIFLDGEHVTFVDLDSFAGADPVLDPAYFLARLFAVPYVIPVQHRRSRAAAAAFAEEYFMHVPASWRDRLALHYAGALLEAAPGIFRRQEPGWSEKMPILLREAGDSLASKIW